MRKRRKKKSQQRHTAKRPLLMMVFLVLALYACVCVFDRAVTYGSALVCHTLSLVIVIGFSLSFAAYVLVISSHNSGSSALFCGRVYVNVAKEIVAVCAAWIVHNTVAVVHIIFFFCGRIFFLRRRSFVRSTREKKRKDNRRKDQNNDNNNNKSVRMPMWFDKVITNGCVLCVSCVSVAVFGLCVCVSLVCIQSERMWCARIHTHTQRETVCAF